MNKNAFTYVELIISMVLIIAIMAASGPLLSRRFKKATGYTAFGTYKCWATYDEANDKVVYHQQLANNVDINDTNLPEENQPKIVDRCTFSLPKGATRFNITLIGGGAGGTIAHHNNFTAETGVGIFGGTLKNMTITQSYKTFDKSSSLVDTSQLPDGTNNSETFSSDYVYLYDLASTVQGLDNSAIKDELTAYEAKKYFIAKLFDAFNNITPGQGGGAGQITELRGIPVEAIPFNNGTLTVTGTNTVSSDNLENFAAGTIYIGIPSRGEKTEGTERNAEAGKLSYLELNTNTSPGINCRSISDGRIVCYAPGGEVGTLCAENCQREIRPMQTYACVNGEGGFDPFNEETRVAGGTCDNLNESNTSDYTYATCTPGSCSNLHPAAAGQMGQGGGGAAYITDKRIYNTGTKTYSTSALATSFQLYSCVLAKKTDNSTRMSLYKVGDDSWNIVNELYTNDGNVNCEYKFTNDSDKTTFRTVEGSYSGNGGYSGGGGVIIEW